MYRIYLVLGKDSSGRTVTMEFGRDYASLIEAQGVKDAYQVSWPGSTYLIRRVK